MKIRKNQPKHLINFNFGAGMSGGVACVLDEADTLPLYLNHDMVEIQPALDPADIARLCQLLEAHIGKIGSAILLSVVAG